MSSWRIRAYFIVITLFSSFMAAPLSAGDAQCILPKLEEGTIRNESAVPPVPSDEDLEKAGILSDEETEQAKGMLRDLLERMRECLMATPKDQGIAEFFDRSYLKRFAAQVGWDVALTESLDVGTYVLINGNIPKNGLRKGIVQGAKSVWQNPTPIKTDLWQDLIYIVPGDTVMLTGKLLGRTDSAVFAINLLAFNGVYSIKRYTDYRQYRSGLAKDHPDLTPKQINTAAAQRYHFTMERWQPVYGLVGPAIFEIMAGTSCLIPGSRWVRSLGYGGKTAIRLTYATGMTAAYVSWRNHDVPPLPTPQKLPPLSGKKTEGSNSKH